MCNELKEAKFGAIKWVAEKIKFYNILLTLIKNFQL